MLRTLFSVIVWWSHTARILSVAPLFGKDPVMTKQSLQQLLKMSALVFASLLTLSVHANLQERKDDRQEQKADRRDRDNDDDDVRRGGPGIVRLPTGQYVTPTAISDAVQQYLNPGLPAYPNRSEEHTSELQSLRHLVC